MPSDEKDTGAWVPIPESEMPQVLDAIVNGGCVVCYQPTGAGHFLYCHEHDDGCDPECVIPPEESAS